MNSARKIIWIRLNAAIESTHAAELLNQQHAAHYETTAASLIILKIHCVQGTISTISESPRINNQYHKAHQSYLLLRPLRLNSPLNLNSVRLTLTLLTLPLLIDVRVHRIGIRHALLLGRHTVRTTRRFHASGLDGN